MKLFSKILTGIALILIASIPSFGQQGTRTFTTSAPAADIGISNQGSGIAYHLLTWTVSGTVSTCTVALDSSTDGVTWSAGGAITGQTCTSSGQSTLTNVVANYVRINVSTLTGGGSITIVWNGYIQPASGITGGPFTNHGILYGTGSSTALAATPAGGAGTLCLVETAGGVPSFGSCSGSAVTAWSSLTAPSAALSITMPAGDITTFTWAAQASPSTSDFSWIAGADTGSSTTSIFSFIDTTANIRTGPLMDIHTVGTSSALPIQITAKGTANGIQMNTTGLLSAIGTGGINATQLGGNTFASPAAIGSGTPAAGTFTTLQANTQLNAGAAGVLAPIVMGNATSGLLTVEPGTGAITSYTVQLPVAQPTTGNTFLSCTAANPAVCTWAAGGGGSVFVHSLSGATPTIAVNSASTPAVDINNFPLTANVTSITLPASTAIADGENLQIFITQGASNFTLPTGSSSTPLTPGASTSLAWAQGGSACPAIGASSGNQLIIFLHYYAAATSYVITGCGTQPAGAAALTDPGTTLGDLYFRGASTMQRLAGNATNIPEFLTSVGSAGAATAPTLTQPQVQDVEPNDTTTGTTASRLVIASGTGFKVATTSSTVADIAGVCNGASCGTSGNADLITFGSINVTGDGTLTAGDYFVPSTTTGGEIHDAGASCPSTGALGIVNVGATTEFFDPLLCLPSSGGTAVTKTVLLTQGADVGATTVLTPGANGWYRMSCYAVITRVATTSSTLPRCDELYTDADSGVAQDQVVSGGGTNNTLGFTSSTPGTASALGYFFAKSGIAIQYKTVGYASSGATSMQFAIRVMVEGPF